MADDEKIIELIKTSFTRMFNIYNSNINFRTACEKMIESRRIELFVLNEETLQNSLKEFGYSNNCVTAYKMMSILEYPKSYIIDTGTDPGWIISYFYALLRIPKTAVYFCHFKHTYYSEREKHVLTALGNDYNTIKKLASIIVELCNALQVGFVVNKYLKYTNAIYQVDIENRNTDIIHIIMIYYILDKYNCAAIAK